MDDSLVGHLKTLSNIIATNDVQGLLALISKWERFLDFDSSLLLILLTELAYRYNLQYNGASLGDTLIVNILDKTRQNSSQLTYQPPPSVYERYALSKYLERRYPISNDLLKHVLNTFLLSNEENDPILQQFGIKVSPKVKYKKNPTNEDLQKIFNPTRADLIESRYDRSDNLFHIGTIKLNQLRYPEYGNSHTIANLARYMRDEIPASYHDKQYNISQLLLSNPKMDYVDLFYLDSSIAPIFMNLVNILYDALDKYYI
ncbi:hypothetical protein D3C87_915020 [compost metagenome]